MKYESGKPALYRSSKKTQRGFCPKCGSTLFALDDDSKYICMTITTLRDKNKIIPEFESFKENSPKWNTRF
ncbi:MAG: GFA family protein [Candidatus Magasanikbacteria bacterium]|nr:GFA family protein [Candidatus Magasanikbacteria bacterium]